MNKEERDLKKDIEKRLLWSNKTLWNTLSKERQDAVINKYYDMSSVENIGIAKALEDNRDIRRNFGSILIGLMLGLFGGLVSSVIFKYFPKDSVVFDVSVVIVFFAFLFMFIRMMDRFSADRLREDKILEHLLKSVDSDSLL